MGARWALLLFAVGLAALPSGMAAPLVAALATVNLIHEAGHLWAARRSGVDALLCECGFLLGVRPVHLQPPHKLAAVAIGGPVAVAGLAVVCFGALSAGTILGWVRIDADHLPSGVTAWVGFTMVVAMIDAILNVLPIGLLAPAAVAVSWAAAGASALLVTAAFCLLVILSRTTTDGDVVAAAMVARRPGSWMRHVTYPPRRD